MQKIKAEIRAREAAMAKCKKDFGFLGFFCDLSGEIIGLNGDLRKFSAAYKAASIPLRSSEQQLREARERQNRARAEFQQAQNALNQTERDLATTEAEIKALKATLARIREVGGDYSEELRQFQYAFSELEGLDPNSDRRYVVKRLRRESADLHNLLIEARKLLDQKGLLLPSGRFICAN
jgi:chromosome segregation ATPase